MQIKYRLKSTRDHQKSYADIGHKPLEFQVGDKVMLEVSPWKVVIQFRKRGKLNPRYKGPFEILARIGYVAYQPKLPQDLSNLHNIFPNYFTNPDPQDKFRDEIILTRGECNTRQN